MLGQNAPIEAAVDAFRRAQFGINDIMRRAQGDAVEAFGLGPSESDHRIVASAPHWRLRDYGDRDASRSVLLVAAPIKRPYIWDLAPSASAIRRCLQHDLHVHLLEWMPASRSTCNNGLDEYTLAISDCVGKVSDRPPKTRPFLMGHSLGGTLAAIFGALAPETIRGLVLLGAPLCFQPGESQFRDALVALAPPDISEVDPFPGSLLSHMSALASPNTFCLVEADGRRLERYRPSRDGNSCADRALGLDEVPLPGKLVHQIIGWLYRENRLCRGALKVGSTLIGPAGLSVPTLAVVNVADEVAPMASIKPYLDATPTQDVQIVEYRGELGVCLQHLGILVGRQAHERVWPEIISWLNSHTRTPPS